MKLIRTWDNQGKNPAEATQSCRYKGKKMMTKLYSNNHEQSLVSKYIALKEGKHTVTHLID